MDGDDDDDNPLAKNALVYMAVAVNGSFKIPVGYFMTNGMTGRELANLTKVCLKKLHDVGVTTISVTCDGPPSNMSMMTELGACLKANDIKTSFQHPLCPGNNVYVFLDICHMIKLVRNTLGKGLVLVDKDGGKVSWQYIVQLENLQREEGLRLGND